MASFGYDNSKRTVKLVNIYFFVLVFFILARDNKLDMKSEKITKLERWILYPLSIILLIVFAFYDLPMMKSLYDQTNVFGRLGENIGEVPFFLLSVFCTALAFRYHPKNSKNQDIILSIVFGFLSLLFAGWGGGCVMNYLKADTYGFGSHLWVAFAVAFAYLIVAYLLAYLIKIEKKEQAYVYAVFVIVVYVATFLAMNLLKFIWYRPRWRFIVATYDPATWDDYFRPWYQIGCSWHFSNNYASFPSGHTMNALGILLLAYSSCFFEKLQGKEWIIRVAAYIWAALVALSRTIMGAHFASDTTAGFIVEFLLIDLFAAHFYPWLGRKIYPALFPPKPAKKMP